MLSTSILYCNKLDDNLLERIDGGDGHHSGGVDSMANPVLDTNHQTPSTSSVATAFKRTSSIPSSALSHKSVNGIKSVDSGAVSVLSEPFSANSQNHTNSQSRYRVRYLGCNTCDARSHKLENGITSYQKPLLELYSAVLRRSVVLRTLYPSFAVLNQVADLSTHGIVIAERDRFHPQRKSTTNTPNNNSANSTRPHSSASSGHTSASKVPAPSIDTVVTKVITPFSNILLWAAVKFQHRSSMKKVKNSAIKRRQIGVAFVPLSCSEAVLDKNAFITLGSKQRFLLGLPHPPLFACVLQKVNTTQRLECHLFVCLTSEDAIGMCNRMAELKQHSSSIGRLQVPFPGQMGCYSYQSSLQSSVGAGSIVSHSRSSNCTTFSSDQSSSFKHRFSANSDIEEEEDFDHDDLNHHLSQQLDSLNSNLTSNLTSISTNESKQQPHHSSIPYNSRLLLLDRANKIDQRHRQRATGHPSQPNHQRQSRRPPQPRSPRNDSYSWTELSSISSTKTRLSKKSNTPSHGSIAQRDYRFQSYKCPQNFVLPELERTSLEGRTPTTVAKVCHQHNSHNKANRPEHNQWSNVSEELQNNRLFAKASAQALLLDHNNVEDTDQDDYDQDNNLNNSHTPSTDNKPNQSSITDDHRLLKSRRFFGDSLRGSKCFPTTFSVAKTESIFDCHNHGSPSANGDHQNSTGWKSSQRLLDPGGGAATAGTSGHVVKPKSHKPIDRQNNSSNPPQSIISHSIFIGDDDEEEIVHSKLHSQPQRSNRAPPPAKQPNQLRSNSVEMLLDCDVKSKSAVTRKIFSADQNVTKTKSVPNLVQNVPELSQSHNTRTSRNNKNSAMLPLAEGANLGVKCFNKSTPVEKWSTMVPTNLPENGCDYCNVEFRCEDCCDCYNPIGQQRQLSCPDCLADDFILDECTMKNFTNSEVSQAKPVQSRTEPKKSIHHDEHDYLHNVCVSRVPRLDYNVHHNVHYPPSSFFGKIRKLSWRSIFSSRKGTLSGSRLWTRIRAGSQRLKGSKRFAKSRVYNKEPLSRIFLPPPNENSERSDRGEYDEHYLKSPPMPRKPVNNSEDKESAENRAKVIQITKEIKDMNLGKDLRKTDKHRNNTNHYQTSSNAHHRSKANNCKTKHNGTQDKRFESSKHPDLIKPFFISHPDKLTDKDVHLEPRIIELGHNGQVLSLSSDSGMEEYDGHSSTENSPTNGTGVPGGGYHMNMRDMELRTKQYWPTQTSHHRNHANGNEKQRKPRQQVPADIRNSTKTNGEKVEKNFQYESGAKTKAKFMKDVRRQAGHWSNTNLENELGYIP